METQTIAEKVLAGYGESRWVKEAVRTSLDRDPVDALRDAENLVAALKQNLYNIQKGVI